MPKRSRKEFENDASDGAKRAPQKAQIQQQRLKVILANGKTQLFMALKSARGSERQKLGRRQKHATQKNAAADFSRLGKEITELKNLNLLVTAEIYLFKTLGRIKSIAATPAFLHLSQGLETSTTSNDPIHVTVTSRLFKAPPVREAMDLLIEAAREILGISKQGRTSQKEHDRDDASSFLPRGASVSSDIEPSSMPTHDRTLQPFTSERHLDDQFENTITNHPLTHEPKNRDMTAPENILIPDDEIGQSLLDAELAPREVAGSDIRSISEQRKRSNSHEDREGSIQEYSDSYSASFSDQAQSNGTNDKPHDQGKKPAKTTFLPSLSLGGYWSGSDSSVTDLDEKTGSAGKVRKNRRGQQARRVVWEKKYGTKAKHVKEQVQGRDHGWDARRGAQTGDSKGRGERPNASHSDKYSKRNVRPSSGANGDPITAKSRGEQPKTVALHPSWEAAKKLKETKKNVAFEGTKLRFS